MVDFLSLSLIVEGIQNWFLTGETNEADNADPIIQIGRLQVLKGHPPRQWNNLQALSFELKDFTVHLKVSDLFDTLGDDNFDKASSHARQTAQQRGELAYAHDPLCWLMIYDRRVATTTPTSLALALDKQHNIERN